MSKSLYKPPSYPVIRFIVRRGMWIAVLLGVLFIGVGFYAAIMTDSWWCAVAGSIAGLLLAGVIASYVEVLHILSDTLIPR